ncbi:MAG TPA: 4-carboxy-4-hydroxy-2-oxoadipate aldolase/oxaloacetate decarboxylase [Gaiellaceae bacterium]
MEGIVRRNPQRADAAVVDAFAQFGVATVHEAQGRTGVLHAYMRPIWKGAHIAGSAVPVSVPPGDNWMIHVAVEQCGDGDVLVVAPTEPCEHGYFGELLATAVQRRGVRGLVIEAGVRDVAELERMRFPAWSKHVSALGTVKERLGTVNVPVEIAGQHVEAGDIVVADDDGVVIVQRERAAEVLGACGERDAKEARSRARYAVGELSLDVSNMREELERKGLRYE